MAQSADQFRRSDVLVWGTVAVVACGAALISANVAAFAPQGMLAGLHNSRVVNDEAAGFASELAAFGGSNGNLLKLAGAQQQMQTAQQQILTAQQQMQTAQRQMLTTEDQMRSSEQQLSASQDQIRTVQQQSQVATTTFDARLATLEKTVAADGTQLTALQTTLPRRVEALMIDKPDASLVTGSIATPATTFAAPRPAPSPAVVPVQTTAVQPMPAAVPPPAQVAAAPVAAAPTASTAGPQWISVAALPAFSTPGAIETNAAAAAPASPPYPMAPRPADMAPREAPSAMAVASTTGGIAAPARRPKPDVKAIGIAIGNPVTADTALANWQQIAGSVGVLLVGTSPLLADDPSGAGKVLVAGPLPGIAAATALCGKIEAATISCMPMPYVGTELNAAASYQ